MQFWGFLPLAVAASLSSNGAYANPFDEVARLDFSIASVGRIAKALPDTGAARDLVIGVLSRDQNGRQNASKRRELELADPQVMPDYEITSLNNDGRVQIVFRLDYTGRQRPTQLVVFHKSRIGVTHASLTAGEGGLGIGEIGSILRDLDGDGTKEIVIDELIFRGRNGIVYPTSGPAPVISNIYRFRNGRLELANSDYPDFYNRTVLPKLQSHLRALEVQRRSADPEAAAERLLDIQATQESIEIAKGLAQSRPARR